MSAVALVFVSVASTVSIVSINKYLFQELNFSYGVTLTAIHFTMTFLCQLMAAGCGVFKPKSVPPAAVLRLSAMFCFSVVFNNLSLMYNSVGFYQVTKLMTIPSLVVLQSRLYGVKFSRNIHMALAVIVLGVGITTVTDVEVNTTGCIFAALAVASTVFYNIWVGTTQKELGVNSFQLLLYQAPTAALMLLVVVPFMDDYSFSSPGSIFHYEFSPLAVKCILASSVVSFSVNMSTYLLLEWTSPVTYQVVGHLKTVTIFIIGFFFFGRTLSPRNAVGIAIALSGMIWYSRVKNAEKAQQDAEKGKDHA